MRVDEAGLRKAGRAGLEQERRDLRSAAEPVVIVRIDVPVMAAIFARSTST
jgi:hypothetical protein